MTEDKTEATDDIAKLLRLAIEQESSALNTAADTEATTVLPLTPSQQAAASGSPEDAEAVPGTAPGEMIGPYELVSMLGEGGFGVVWRAVQHKPIHREVALKVIKPGMDSREIIDRFEGERQALALMDHPHIAAVLDAGKTGSGRLYFAMELVRGAPLTEYCDTHRLTLRQRLGLFIPVCQAVQHAHQKGVLHRDLKPSNILVEMVDGRPVPKVIDFGIAKALQSGADAAEGLSLLRTTGLSLIGTPAYMSPEQAGLSGQDVDSRSDIYSLGVVLYELLTGGTPLTSAQLKKAGMDEVLRMIREEDPPTLERGLTRPGADTQGVAERRQTELRRLTAQLRGDLEWIAMKALEKDRERRYASAAALAEDIEHHLRDEPVSAGPPGAAYRLKKMARRHRGPLIAASLVLGSLLAGLGFTIWQAVRATRAEQVAEARLQHAQQARDSAEGLITEAIYGLREKLMALGKLGVMEDMVKAADGYYRGLPKELQNIETQRHLASLALNRAMIALAQGNVEEQEKLAQECLQLTEALAAAQPEREDLQKEACLAMLSLCKMHGERGDSEALLSTADAVVARAGAWLAAHPDTLWAMHNQVLAHNLAALYIIRELARPEQGSLRFETAAQTARQMREAHGDHALVFEAEGLIHAGNAKVGGGLKDNAQRESEALAAAEAFARAIALGGDSALLREEHASALNRAGSAVRERGQKTQDTAAVKQGEDMIREALAARRKLVELEPGRGEWWRDLAHSIKQVAGFEQEAATEHTLRLEEMDCRDEALARSPHRPLLYAERAISLELLAKCEMKLSQPDPAKAAGHLLRGLEDQRRSAEMNGMKPVISTIRSLGFVRMLADIAVKHPAQSLPWLDRARDILAPVAEKMEGADFTASLAYLTTSRQKVLAALGQEKEEAEAQTRLAAMAGGQTTPLGMHDHARGLIVSLKNEFDAAVKTPSRAEKLQLMRKIEAAVPQAEIPLMAALEKEPQNPAFRETAGMLWRLRGNLLTHQEMTQEALAAYEKGIAVLDPAAHSSLLWECHSGAVDRLLALKETAAAENHLQAMLGLYETKCGATAPPPEASDFDRLGSTLTRLARCRQALNDIPGAISSCLRAVEAHRRARELNPKTLNYGWNLVRAQMDLAELLLSAKQPEQIMPTAQPALTLAVELAQQEPSANLINSFISLKVSPLMGSLKDAGRVTEAVALSRGIITLRQRAEDLGGQAPTPFHTSQSARLVLAELLLKQNRGAEAEEEIQAAMAEAGKLKDQPAAHAEFYNQLRNRRSSQGKLEDAEEAARTAVEICAQHGLDAVRLIRQVDHCEALLGLGKAAECLALCEKTWEEAAQKPLPGEHPRLRGEIAEKACKALHDLHLNQTGAASAVDAQMWTKRKAEGQNAEKQTDARAYDESLSGWREWLTVLAESGNLDEHARHCSALLALTSQRMPSATAQARLALGILNLPDAASDFIQQAADLSAAAFAANPQDEHARLAQALALLRLGKSKDALDLAKTSYNHGDPGLWLCFHALAAKAHRQLGQDSEAETQLTLLKNAPPEKARHFTSPASANASLARLLVREASLKSAGPQ